MSTKLPLCALPWQYLLIEASGGVLPCYDWWMIGSLSLPALGCLNKSSIREIWNSKSLQTLRRKLLDGDIEGTPCRDCRTRNACTNGVLPFLSAYLFEHEPEHCYRTRLPDAYLSLGPSAYKETLLYEDSLPLPGNGALHDSIRSDGQGRYSLWNEYIYFSSSDNTDPNINGKSYYLKYKTATFRLGQLDHTEFSSKNELAAYREYKNCSIELKSMPSKISFITTGDCNIDCPSCYQNETRKLNLCFNEQASEEINKLLPYLTALTHQGGEPLMMPSFNKFVETFADEQTRNFTLTFNTNGTLINKKIIEKLHKFTKNELQVSIDSFDEEIFSKIRPGANLNKILKNLEMLTSCTDASKFNCAISVFLFKNNISKLSETIQKIYDHNFIAYLACAEKYPIHTALTCFQHFAAETSGWLVELDKTLQYVRKKAEERHPASTAFNPEPTLRHLRGIILSAQDYYKDARPVAVKLHDPSGSLAAMRRPCLVLGTCASAEIFPDYSLTTAMTIGSMARPVAYVLLEHGPGDYLLRVPLPAMRTGQPLVWGLYDSAYDLTVPLVADRLRLDDGTPCEALGWKKLPETLEIVAPRFIEIPQRPNVVTAKAQQLARSRGEGNYLVFDPAGNTNFPEIYERYLAGLAKTGTGYQGPVPPGDRPENLPASCACQVYRTGYCLRLHGGNKI